MDIKMLILSARLRSSEKLLLFAINDRPGKIAANELALMTSLSPRSILRIVKNLSIKGVLNVTNNKTENGCNWRNSYSINIEHLKELIKPSKGVK